MPWRRFVESKWAILATLVLCKAGLHLATQTRYGFFRDELYYMACGEHPAWGYVDHPPVVPVIARLTRMGCGDSLRAIRCPSIAAISLVVVIAGVMTHRLGGGRLAVPLAGLAVVVSPAFLAVGTFLSVNVFDILWWSLTLLLLMLLIERPRPWLWLAVGLVFGIGLLTKYTIVFLAFSVFVGLLLTSDRRQLLRPWPWIAVLIAFAVASPNLLWQYDHGWPTAEFLRNIRLAKNYPVSAFEFAAMQFAVIHPVLFPLWVIGLCHLLFAPSARRDRLFAWVYIVVILILMTLRAKFYYAFPLYPVLFAAGATAVEAWIRRTRRKWVAYAVPIAMCVGGAVTLPYALPVVSIDSFLKYDRFLNIHRHIRFERGRDRRKPIVYADMFGWEEIAEGVRGVLAGLPPASRRQATILTANYGEAGAVDLFGSRYALPGAVSGHNSYHLWGPGPRSWTVVIAVGFETATLKELFESVTIAKTIHNVHARETEVHLHVCHRLKIQLDEAWRRLKHSV